MFLPLFKIPIPQAYWLLLQLTDWLIGANSRRLQKSSGKELENTTEYMCTIIYSMHCTDMYPSGTTWKNFANGIYVHIARDELAEATFQYLTFSKLVVFPWIDKKRTKSWAAFLQHAQYLLLQLVVFGQNLKQSCFALQGSTRRFPLTAPCRICSVWKLQDVQVLFTAAAGKYWESSSTIMWGLLMEVAPTPGVCKQLQVLTVKLQLGKMCQVFIICIHDIFERLVLICNILLFTLVLINNWYWYIKYIKLIFLSAPVKIKLNMTIT